MFYDSLNSRKRRCSKRGYIRDESDQSKIINIKLAVAAVVLTDRSECQESVTEMGDVYKSI